MNGEIVQKVEQKPRGLPPGWRREIVVRKNGMSAGKTDVYYYSPCGKKFRSKPQIARFLGETADLTCFDFSRAGSLGDGTRRRARDRNPQGTTKKFDPRHMIPAPVRPLSANPLRPSGPVRRTCGVIKLPVMLLSPPVGNTELRDSVLGQQGGGADNKVHTLNVVVQSLWERRLNTLSPQDHLTGKEISRLENQSIPSSHVRSDNPLILPSSVVGGVVGGATSLPPQQPVLPSLLGSSGNIASTTPISHKPMSIMSSSPSPSPSSSLSSLSHTKYVPHSSTNHTSGVMSGTRLLQLHQQQVAAAQVKLATHRPPPPPPSSSLSLTITDSDVKLQEQRVQLLRQQLMAAQGSL